MTARFNVKIDDSAWQIARQPQAVISAASAALRETARNSVNEGRRQIASSGRFTDPLPRNTGFTRPGWLSGLQYRIENADTMQVNALIFHRVGLADIFEFGATIQGHPLLWIPTRPGMPPPGVFVRRRGGKLTAATVRGTPVLFDADDRDRHRKPLYIGVPSIRIPKKWRITEIVQENVARFIDVFWKHFRP